MKTALYLRYTTRSLLRGGQHTLLAIFCVAVGVMAIVSLELVGQMINGALSSNARNANGGDLQVVAQYTPLKEADLAFFDKLKQQGIIVQYTPTIDINGQTFIGTSRRAFSVMVVDPSTFPVIPALTLTTPTQGGLPALLKGNQVLVDQGFVDQTHLHVGENFVLHLANADQQTMQARVAGVVADSGVFAQTNDFLLISLDAYRATLPTGALAYSHVYISTDQNQAHTNAANTAIQREFPLAASFTAADALNNQQNNSALIKKFLDIAGLLALLVGGVGIVNTMKVLLSRRTVEIAMLKTSGYTRRDLLLLFGLEAGLLGLIGGSIGAMLAIGVSFLLQILVQNFFTSFSAPFVLDWALIGGGIVIGVATALIFGLIPIAEAANVRPLHVLRDMPDNHQPGKHMHNKLALLFLLSLLFCILSTLILNDLLWGILAVYGGFALLGLLGLLFSLVPSIIGKLPVPDRYSIGYVCLVATGVISGGLFCFVSLTLGGLMLAIAFTGFVVVLLPRSWKVNTGLALRNISRQRARTTTTLLAVFVGVFTIGLILNTGENVINRISTMRNSASTFNIVVFTNQQEGQALLRQYRTVPGLTPESLNQRTYTDVVPVSIDNQPLERLLPPRNPGSQSGLFGTERADVIHLLSSFEGYDLAHNQLPDLKNGVDITEGRSLTAADAGTTNILIQDDVLHVAGFEGKIKVGSELVVTSQDGKTSRTLHVVGIFNPKVFSYIGKVMAPAELVQRLAPVQQPRSIFYLRIDAQQVGQAIDRISQIAPNADIRNYAAFGDSVTQYLNDSVLLLIVIASLSLLAAIVMIANAVALAMLERRREMGILKAVGYTSYMVLSGVLIENGIVAGTGAWLAMLFVSLIGGVLGVLLGISPYLNWYLGLGMIPGTALLAMLTAIAVAWRSAHARPLDVLRYE